MGRDAHTGGPALWYTEASAWCEGPIAWQEFESQVTEDIIDLHRALAQDVIRFLGATIFGRHPGQRPSRSSAAT